MRQASAIRSSGKSGFSARSSLRTIFNLRLLHF
jgi:hypothetical protein